MDSAIDLNSAQDKRFCWLLAGNWHSASTALRDRSKLETVQNLWMLSEALNWNEAVDYIEVLPDWERWRQSVSISRRSNHSRTSLRDNGLSPLGYRPIVSVDDFVDRIEALKAWLIHYCSRLFRDNFAWWIWSNCATYSSVVQGICHSELKVAGSAA